MSKHGKYSVEFKERAVELVLKSGFPISQVAKDLGVRYEPLRRWVKQARADQGEQVGVLSSEERERLRFLEKEYKRLSQANEILKAASIFFANEINTNHPR